MKCTPATVMGFLVAVFMLSGLVVLSALTIQQHNIPTTTSLTTTTTATNTTSMGRRAGKSATEPPRIPMTWSAMCEGSLNPNCTRFDIWSKCFMVLIDRHPKDGYLTKREVQIFLDTFLRSYEKILAPTAEKIATDCDHPPGGRRPTGRVNWVTFNATQELGCLGSARDICYCKGACDRELKKLGLPLTTKIKVPQ